MVAVTVTDSGNSSGSSNCGDNENSTRGGSDDDGHQKAPVLLPIQLQQLHTCSDRRNTTSTKHKERNSFQGS